MRRTGPGIDPARGPIWPLHGTPGAHAGDLTAPPLLGVTVVASAFPSGIGVRTVPWTNGPPMSPGPTDATLAPRTVLLAQGHTSVDAPGRATLPLVAPRPRGRE